LAPLHQIDCGITKGASTVGGLHPIGFGFGGTFGNTLTGADALLSGETDGMASDFTRSDGTGYVSVKDTVTPANVVSNVIADAWWTNSGTSPKLINTSAGALAWSPHNLCIQSQTVDNASWTKNRVAVTANAVVAPDGTTTGDFVKEDATAANTHFATVTAFATVAGAAYTFSAYIKQGVGTRWSAIASNIASTGLYFNPNTGALGTAEAGIIDSGVVDAGSGWYRVWFTALATGATHTFSYYITEADNDALFSGDNTSGIYVWGAQVNRGYEITAHLATTTAALYGLGIDYSGGSYGLLVEPAATNLALQSQDLATTWTNTNTTETTNSTTAPDGTTTADTLTASSTTDCRIAQTTAARTDNAAHTTSVYAKKGTSNYLIIVDNYIADGTGSGAWFNLNTGAVGTKQANVTTSTITDVGNGWYRCTITGTNTSSTTQAITLYVADADNSLGVTNGNTIYLWGAQCEVGTVATSHIPTFAATVTRAKDLIDSPNSIFPIGATEQSIFVWMTDLGTANGKTLVAIGDGAGASYDTGVIYKSTTGPSVKSGSYTAGATQADFTIGNITVGTAFKVAARYKANDFHAAVGGTLSAAPDTSGTYPSGMIEARLGFPSDENPWGRYFHIVALPRAYSNAELQSETA
jgi:hypothetical protein